MHAALALSQRAIDEVRTLARQEGPQGPRGEAGKDGRLPIAKQWKAGVHYAGDVVRHNGSTFQALADTAEVPPSDSWGELASQGADGRGFTLRGTYKADETYSLNDVVVVDRGSFGAKRDNPGPCPGEDWQLLAGAGGRGKEGPPGPRGPKGDTVNAPKIVKGVADAETMSLSLVFSDGQSVSVDLTPIAEQILEAAR